MASPIRVSIPHQLGRAAARQRIDTGFSKLASQLPGGASVSDQRWDGDQLAFRITALGQMVSGTIDVQETAVHMDIELPGLLGQMAGAFKARLQQVGQLLLTRD